MSHPYQNALYTAEASRQADHQTIEEFGIPGFTLMETAARRAADHITENYPSSISVLALCGKGNNGGDAVALCRILSDYGYRCVLWFPAGMKGTSPDTATNLRLLRKLIKNGGKDSIRITEKKPDFSGFSLIIDGMLGTGLDRELEGPFLEAAELAAASGLPVAAMDIPTGLNADSGRVMGFALKATHTFMFGTRKRGCYLGEGIDYSGERLFCPLPFPAYLMKQDFPVRVMDSELMEAAEREYRQALSGKPALHKYEAGNVYVAAGSPGLTGAAVMAAKAAWSTGCGSVKLFTTKEMNPAYDAHLVEITRGLVPSSDGGLMGPEAADYIAEELDKKPATLVLGPGLLDADGFRALKARDISKYINPQLKLVVTPHPGEQAAVHGKAVDQPEDAREWLNSLPCRNSTIYLRKGLPAFAVTISEARVAGYDTRIFSRTGYGDVLSGLIAGTISKMNFEKTNRKSLMSAVCIAMMSHYEKTIALENPSPEKTL
jgi:hydroxyethylthiazole kinase-like uncharacterized protein yjeF